MFFSALFIIILSHYLLIIIRFKDGMFVPKITDFWNELLREDGF